MTDVADIVAAIRSVVGSGQHSLHEPSFEGREVEYLNHCISTTMVSYVGSYVDRFETELSNFVGAKHCISVSSGTDALLIALMSLDIGYGDEIITTPFSFISTAEVIALIGAKPIFVDIDEKSYNIDPKKI